MSQVFFAVQERVLRNVFGCPQRLGGRDTRLISYSQRHNSQTRPPSAYRNCQRHGATAEGGPLPSVKPRLGLAYPWRNSDDRATIAARGSWTRNDNLMWLNALYPII